MPMMPRRPAWLPLLLALWWLACPMAVQAQSETPLPPENDAPLRCFNALEWDVLQDEVDAIIEDTAEAAVKAATAPLLADLAGERAARKAWEAEYRKAAADAVAARDARSWAVYCAAAGWICAAIAAGVAVLAVLIR